MAPIGDVRRYSWQICCLLGDSLVILLHHFHIRDYGKFPAECTSKNIENRSLFGRDEYSLRDIYISQGSGPQRLRCGGILHRHSGIRRGVGGETPIGNKTSTKGTMDPEGARFLTYSTICLR